MPQPVVGPFCDPGHFAQLLHLLTKTSGDNLSFHSRVRRQPRNERITHVDVSLLARLSNGFVNVDDSVFKIHVAPVELFNLRHSQPSEETDSNRRNKLKSWMKL